MPSSTRSNKETQLLFSPDPASLERSIRKEAHSLSTDNNTSVSLDYAQPPPTNTRSPLSTDNTHLLSSDIFHPTSIDIPSRASIDTEPRGMVAPLILVRDNNGDRHDQEGKLRNAAVVKEEKLQEVDFEVESLMSFGGSHRCRSTPDTEHRSTYTNPNRSTGILEHRSTMPTESTGSCNAVKILTHEEFAAKHPHPPSPDNTPKIDVHDLTHSGPNPNLQNTHQSPLGHLQMMEKILWKRIGFLCEPKFTPLISVIGGKSGNPNFPRVIDTEHVENNDSKLLSAQPPPSSSHLGLLIYLLLVCKLAGFLKTLEYWPRDKFWDIVSGCLILCLEMLETSVLGLGQDLGLIMALGGAMTTSTYVSCIVFDLIPSRFKVRDMFPAYVTCMVGIKHLFVDNF
ncbi:hypothetical protein F2Q70_00004360 [Brassica cretica]|uniref:Uncharacterized protein n=1 Tax=Brassica cretica TaxID=69181 RepID=A0A8S9J004_BRACR|nr:hypothetical protein F2Q70_00004360 [Brassica cretica]